MEKIFWHTAARKKGPFMERNFATNVRKPANYFYETTVSDAILLQVTEHFPLCPLMYLIYHRRIPDKSSTGGS